MSRSPIDPALGFADNLICVELRLLCHNRAAIGGEAYYDDADEERNKSGKSWKAHDHLRAGCTASGETEPICLVAERVDQGEYARNYGSLMQENLFVNCHFRRWLVKSIALHGGEIRFVTKSLL